MLKLPKVTDEELEVYKGKKILIYAVSGNLAVLNKIFKELGFEVVGVYTKSVTPKIFIKGIIDGYKVISTEKFKFLLNNEDSIIVQGITSGTNELGDNIYHGVAISEVPGGKIVNSYGYIVAIKELRNPIFYYFKIFRWKQYIKKSYRSKELEVVKKSYLEYPIIMCSPPKTADVTVSNTLRQFSGKINFMNVVHRARVLKSHKNKKLKIIMGVRDPIAQNLSVYFHELVGGAPLERWILAQIYKQENIINMN